jgi:ribosome biogenesis GTPase
VETDGGHILCRIKGKTLPEARGEYNPLAPGDRVAFDEGTALIEGRLERRNRFARWKRERVQTIAANLDAVLCVCCAAGPPFRPRFVDRVAVIAEAEQIPFVVVYNKAEPEPDASVQQRLEAWQALGYAVIRTSAKSRHGLEELDRWLRSGVTVMIGQSGVGKSSLINALVSGAEQRIGEISRKHVKGRHTTSTGVLLRDRLRAVIDTPGIRELLPYPLTQLELAAAYREFRRRDAGCRMQDCTHVHEPDCAVKAAVAREEIHPDRYQSYLRTIEMREHIEQTIHEQQTRSPRSNRND